MVNMLNGDVLSAPPHSMVIHQCNCSNGFGSGVAKAVADKYPHVKSEYHGKCESNKRMGRLREELLGDIQVVKAGSIYICNMFSQLDYGSKKVHTNYMAMRTGLLKAKEVALELDIGQIAIPYLIGCVRGGGDWSIVSRIIEETIGDLNVILYNLGGEN